MPDFPLKEALGAVATVFVGLLAYRQWKRTKRSGKFIEDRETAYKSVWQALEDIHLHVRSQRYSQDRFDDLARKANTLLIQHGLHVAARDRQLAADYMRALEAFAVILAGIDAAHPARREIALTRESPALLPEYSACYNRVQSARQAVMEGFQRAIGAGQI